MGTSKYGFPKISKNDSVKITRDFNALADAIDRGVFNEFSRVDTTLRSIASGAPKAVFQTFSDLQNAKPNGDTNIYLVVADGKWYYWGGESWLPGGVYQGTSLSEKSIGSSALDDSLATSIASIDALIGNKKLFNTFIDGFVRTNIDTGQAPVSGIMIDQGQQTFYESSTDTIISVKNDSIVTFIEIVISHADLSKIKEKGGFTFYSILKKTTGVLEGINVWLYAVNGNDVEVIDQKQIASPIQDTENIVEYYYPKNIIPESAESLRIYIRQPGAFTSATIAARSICLQLTDTRGLGNISLSDYTSDVKDSLGIAQVESRVEALESKTKKWQGEEWNAVGDSITEQGLYVTRVANDTGLTPFNYGISSCTMAINNTYLQNKSVVERVVGLNGNTAIPDRNLWTVFAGTNDWYYQTPVGTFSNTSQSTFYGALRAIVENILQRPNHPVLILFTPLQSNRNGNNDAGVPMQAYRDAIKTVADYYSLPIVDLYGIGGFNPLNLSKFAPDGVHPNNEGTDLFSPKIVQEILRN